MRITKRFVLSVLGLALSAPMLSVSAQEQNPPSFYEKKEEGWFWHFFRDFVDKVIFGVKNKMYPDLAVELHPM